MKVLTAAQVKRLPEGTDIYLVQEGAGKRGLFYIVKSGRKKFLKGMFGTHEIVDRAGWHYEKGEDEKV